MRQLVVEVSDQEMALLEVLAKAERLTPGGLAKLALQKVLAEKAGEAAQSSDTAGAQRPDIARAKRLAAAMTMHGIWQGKVDKPQDGVAYQREVRAE